MAGTFNSATWLTATAAAHSFSRFSILSDHLTSEALNSSLLLQLTLLLLLSNLFVLQVRTPKLRYQDPFLMLDELKLPVNQASAGFPDHPHR